MTTRPRAYWLTALLIVALLVGPGNVMVSRPPSASADAMPVLTGSYLADQGTGNYYAMYYVRQVSGTVWWAGFSMDPNLALDQQFHRGVDFTNLFKGSMTYDTASDGLSGPHELKRSLMLLLVGGHSAQADKQLGDDQSVPHLSHEPQTLPEQLLRPLILTLLLGHAPKVA
jgi:hypothetical protein